MDLKIWHIQFSNYAVVFKNFKSKGHHTGEDNICHWHVYDNLIRNYLCPVLALEWKILSLPQTLRTNALLFQGWFQYEGYSKLYLKFIDKK